MPQEEIFSEPAVQEIDEDFVDPREVQQVLREIKDIRRELTRFAKQLAKMANSGDDVNQVNALLEQIKSFEANILAEQNLRDTIQEFREANIWQDIQRIRAKIEIPKEMKQWDKEIKRIEKLLKQKKIQNLSSDFGLDLGAAANKLEETKAILATVQELYNNGDLEGAMEEFDGLRQDFHPGELASVLQRLQEIANRLRAVKDEAIKNQIRETLSEVANNFNDGEFRIAREVLDENFNSLMQLIMKATSVGKKKGQTRDNWFQAMEKVETKMKEKSEQKKEQLQEMRQEVKMKVEGGKEGEKAPAPVTAPAPVREPVLETQPVSPAPVQ